MRLGAGNIFAVILISIVSPVLVIGHAADEALAPAQLVDRWPLPSLGVNGEFEGESITYLGKERLLVADSRQESIWSIDTDTGALTPWLVAPSYGMFPTTIRHEPMDDVVFVASSTGTSSKGVLPARYLVLGRDASLKARWTLPDREGAWRTGAAGRRFAVSPDGLMAWLTYSPPSPNGDQYSRVSTANRYGQRWLGGRCPESYSSLAIDASGRYYFYLPVYNGRGTAPSYRIDRAADRHCRQPAVFYQYNASQPYWSWVTMTGWPSPDRVHIADGMLVNAFDTSARRLFTTFVPQHCPDCVVASVAARPDNHFAVLVRESMARPTGPTARHKAQVVQYNSEGIPRLRTVFRGLEIPVMWSAGRLTVDEAGKVLVLYPDSDMVATFTEMGTFERTTAVASWAGDLDASGSLLAVKGSPGQLGTVQVLDSAGSLRWQVPCKCDESAAVAIADDRVVTGNAFAARLAGFSRLDGSALPPLAQLQQGTFWPLDVTATDEAIYVINGMSRHIEVFSAKAAGAGARRYIAASDDAFRIDAAPDGRLAALTRSGNVEIVAPDGSGVRVIDLRSMAGAEDVEPRDVAWSPSGNLLILDARRPSVLRLRMSAAPPAEVTRTPTPMVSDDPGDCLVTGSKWAEPKRVMVNDDVRVNLHVDIDCPFSPRPPLDVLVVLSGDSMNGGNGSEARNYYSAMLQAAERLAGALDLGRDRLAVYQWAYGQHASFTTDLSQIRSAVRRVGPYYDPLRPPDAESYVNLDWALRYLADQARPGADRVLVQISKPSYMVSYNEPDLAERARRVGVRPPILIYRPWKLRPRESGLPPEWASRLLGMVADPADLLDLEDVLASDALLQRLGAPYQQSSVRDVELWDTVGPDVRLVPGSSQPLAQESSDTVIWRSAAMPVAGISVTLRIRPNRAGHLPTNKEAVAYFADPAGVRRRFVFPIPYIDVIAPTPTSTAIPTPTATPTATVTPTPAPIPQPVYLPLALKEGCAIGQRRMDVALVIDASTSMLENTQEGRSKLAVAVEAVRLFLDGLDPLFDQAAVIEFNGSVRLLQDLTGSRADLNAALSRIEVQRQTRIDLGVEVAHQELGSERRRVGNAAVMIVLTDGKANPVGPDVAVAKADLAKEDDITILTIGLGEDLDLDALLQMASKPEYFYRAPDGEDLKAIYEAIAVEIPCPVDNYWGKRP